MNNGRPGSSLHSAMQELLDLACAALSTVPPGAGEPDSCPTSDFKTVYHVQAVNLEFLFNLL